MLLKPYGKLILINCKILHVDIFASKDEEMNRRYWRTFQSFLLTGCEPDHPFRVRVDSI